VRLATGLDVNAAEPEGPEVVGLAAGAKNFFGLALEKLAGIE
jgi:hypothetical protein